MQDVYKNGVWARTGDEDHAEPGGGGGHDGGEHLQCGLRAIRQWEIDGWRGGVRCLHVHMHKHRHANNMFTDVDTVQNVDGRTMNQL